MNCLTLGTFGCCFARLCSSSFRPARIWSSWAWVSLPSWTILSSTFFSTSGLRLSSALALVVAVVAWSCAWPGPAGVNGWNEATAAPPMSPVAKTPAATARVTFLASTWTLLAHSRGRSPYSSLYHKAGRLVSRLPAFEAPVRASYGLLTIRGCPLDPPAGRTPARDGVRPARRLRGRRGRSLRQGRGPRRRRRLAHPGARRRRVRGRHLPTAARDDRPWAVGDPGSCARALGPLRRVARTSRVSVGGTRGRPHRVRPERPADRAPAGLRRGRRREALRVLLSGGPGRARRGAARRGPRA